jgi:hypothetical protein
VSYIYCFRTNSSMELNTFKFITSNVQHNQNFKKPSTNNNNDDDKMIQYCNTFTFKIYNLLPNEKLYILKKCINSALHRLWQYITVWCAGGCLVVWEVHTEHEARDADCFSSTVLIHHHLTQTCHNQPGSEPRIVYKCKFIINNITCQEY